MGLVAVSAGLRGSGSWYFGSSSSRFQITPAVVSQRPSAEIASGCVASHSGGRSRAQSPAVVIWALSPNRNFGVSKGSGGIGLSWDIRLWVGHPALRRTSGSAGTTGSRWDIQLRRLRVHEGLIRAVIRAQYELQSGFRKASQSLNNKASIKA